MMTFWLIAGFMLLVAVVLVITPILWPRADSGISSYDASVAIHRQRLEALEQQHTDGTLQDLEFQQAREELEMTLIEETRDQSPGADPGASKRSRPTKFTILSVLFLVPSLSLGFYAWLGNYETLQLLENPTAMQALMDQYPPRRDQVEHMVNNLKLRVRQSPDDIRGWEMLAKGQLSLSRFSDAADSYDLLIRVNGETPDRLANYAEAASLANRMKFSPLSRKRLERALAIAPNHPKALMMGALAALQSGNKQLARARLMTLLPMHAPDSEQARLVTMLLGHTEEPNSTTASTATPSALPAIPATPKTAPDSNTAATGKISVALSLATDLQGKISGQERVFVFARAVGGPPMPVAVKVLKASDLPTSLILDDNSSMPSGRPLSSVAQVLVGARISFSGNAVASTGDLEGKSAPLKPKDNPTITLVIDRIRP